MVRACEAAAERALALDPELTDARLTLAHVRAHYDLDWAGAERLYADVVTVDPATPTALPPRHSAGIPGPPGGRAGRAATARQLEPGWAPAVANTAFLLTLQGRYAEAATEARRAIELDPSFPHAQSVLGRALVGQGRYDEALEVFRQRSSPGPRGYADVAFTLVSSGRTGRRARSSRV